ncbi:MAG: hypothetical protein ACREHG_05220 [Candidatus Saccharimonadales bacterium]
MDWHKLVTVVPILLVNAIAIIGQTVFWHEHLDWPWAVDAIFAMSLESIAIFIAYHAHLAQIANDSAMKLRFSAYAMGATIGVLNASHFLGVNGAITAAAIAMGILSASSPWLWSIYSRRVSRSALLANGLIEPHAVRLGSTRWLMHPLNSFRVARYASWHTETNAEAAIAAWGASLHPDDADVIETIPEPPPVKAAKIVKPKPRKPESVSKGSRPRGRRSDKAIATREAYDALGHDAEPAKVITWLAEHGYPDVDRSYLGSVKSRMLKSLANQT